MPQHGKRYTNATRSIGREQLYEADQAITLIKQAATAKFNETIEVHCRLGIDVRKGDQMVRGTTVLPHGTGKTPKVAVIASGDLARAATEGGADVVGDTELIDRIDGGWMEFDLLVAAQDMMRLVSRLGRKLTTRMPNAKAGTVVAGAEDMKRTVEQLKKGKIEYRADKTGVVHSIIGKASFEAGQLTENFTSLMEALVKAKPASAKGVYLRSITVTSTMGPGIKVDPTKVMAGIR